MMAPMMKFTVDGLAIKIIFSVFAYDILCLNPEH
jgi:hypothetical protein